MYTAMDPAPFFRPPVVPKPQCFCLKRDCAECLALGLIVEPFIAPRPAATEPHTADPHAVDPHAATDAAPLAS